MELTTLGPLHDVVRAEEHETQHIHRGLRGLELHHVPATNELKRSNRGALADDNGDTDHPHRLLLGTAAGAGDAGHADADVDTGPRADPVGHRPRDWLAHRAM